MHPHVLRRNTRFSRQDYSSTCCEITPITPSRGETAHVSRHPPRNIYERNHPDWTVRDAHVTKSRRGKGCVATDTCFAHTTGCPVNHSVKAVCVVLQNNMGCDHNFHPSIRPPARRPFDYLYRFAALFLLFSPSGRGRIWSGSRLAFAASSAAPHPESCGSTRPVCQAKFRGSIRTPKQFGVERRESSDSRDTRPQQQQHQQRNGTIRLLRSGLILRSPLALRPQQSI